MRNPLSKVVKEIQPSGIRKFFDIVSEMKDAISWGWRATLIPLGIFEKKVFILSKGKTFYTSNAGLKELKIEICNYMKRRYQMEYDFNKETIVTVGAVKQLILLFVQC